MIVSGDAIPPIRGLQKIRFVDGGCGFQGTVDEKSREYLKAISYPEGTCSGGEFVMSMAGEAIRYADNKSVWRGPVMKTLLKIVAAILVCLAILLVVFRFTGLNPHGGIPGLWLTGDLVTTPVADWSFIDEVPNIKLETRSRFLLPHSVTINCLAYKGQFYVSSTHPVGSPRSWDANVMRDPRVRIKIGDKLYDRTLVLVTDPAEKDAVIQVREKKYQLKVPANATIDVFHVTG